MTPTHSDGLAAARRKPRKTGDQQFKEWCAAREAKARAAVARHTTWAAEGRLGLVDVPHHWVQRVHLRCAHGCGHGRMWWKSERKDRAHVCDLCGYVEIIEDDIFPHFLDGSTGQHYPSFT